MPQIRTQDLMWKEQNDIVTVLILESGKFLEFNKVGSTIWKGLAAGDTSDMIVTKLAANYSIPREKIQADVTTFIDRMYQSKLLADGNNETNNTKLSANAS